MSNQWHQKLTEVGGIPTAEELLDLMRPEVEKIIPLYTPNTCQSQSLLAKRALEHIDHALAEARKNDPSLGSWMKMAPVRRHRDTLSDFLAVHRTVWILEGRAI